MRFFFYGMSLEFQLEKCFDEIQEDVDKEYYQRNDGPVHLQDHSQDNYCRRGCKEDYSDLVLAA